MSHPLRRLTHIVGAVLLTACASVTDSAGDPQPILTSLPRTLSSDEQIAATATTEFGLALFRRMNTGAVRDSNLAVSPISASVVLGMLMNGAEQETLNEIRSTLGFGTREVAQVNAAYKALIPLLQQLDPSVTMRFANAAWFALETPPAATFSQALRDAFSAQIETVSFSAPSTIQSINAWASGATNGRIPEIVTSFRGDEIAILANATYFKGKWRSQFDAAQTRPAPFRTAPNRSLTVPTMFSPSGLFRAGVTADGTQVAELPFGGDAFVMTIVQPPLGSLNAAIDSLTPARWQALVSRLSADTRSDQLHLPKFRLETARELRDDLMALGMRRAFQGAQLRPLFRDPVPAAVSSVRQKVFIDINEEGGEAAAVTTVEIIRTSAQPGVVVDQPFFFAIRERLTGTVLFLGKVVNPAAR